MGKLRSYEHKDKDFGILERLGRKKFVRYSVIIGGMALGTLLAESSFAKTKEQAEQTEDTQASSLYGSRNK